VPSPFPGMDPSLEARGLWPGFHASLITQVRYLLAPRLAPRYFVDVERRVYLIDGDDPAQRHVVPDVSVTAVREPAAPAPPGGRAPRGAVVVLMAQETEVREPRQVIRGARGGEVVTVLEVLSPSNKTAGSQGRREYLVKRREVLRSAGHLLEVDLLRGGERLPSVQPLPPSDYCVHVSRVATRPLGEVYAWSVRDPAPVLPIPLREGDPDVSLDLGEAIRLTYEQSRYDVELDYRGEPAPPLSQEDAAWADALLRAAGLR